MSQRFNALRFGGQPPQPPQLQPPPSLVGIENHNPSQTWGQLMASARRPAAPSAALCMIDGISSEERAPSSAPRLPADNMNFLGMRIPGKLQQSHHRSYKFSSQFNDPFL